VRSGIDAGAGIRVAIGKKVAFVSVSSLDINRIIETAKLAAKIAKTKEEDPNFTHLPDPMRGYAGHGIFDEGLASLGSEELSGYVSRFVKDTKQISNLRKMDLFLTRANYTYAVVNSRGISIGDYGSVIFVWYEVDLEENGKRGKGMDIYVARKLNEDELFSIMPRAVEMAEEGLKAKKPKEPFRGDVKHLLAPSI